MIRREELQRMAARAGVRVELQERDYALGWFLLGLAQTPALGPGTGLQGWYGAAQNVFPRLPFLRGPGLYPGPTRDEQALQSGIEVVCREVSRASGMTMQLALWKQTRGVQNEEAYQARIAYIGPLVLQPHLTFRPAFVPTEVARPGPPAFGRPSPTGISASWNPIYGCSIRPTGPSTASAHSGPDTLRANGSFPPPNASFIIPTLTRRQTPPGS